MSKLKQKIQKKLKNSKADSMSKKKPLKQSSLDSKLSSPKISKTPESLKASTLESASTVQTQASGTDASDFKAAIAESKAAIHEAEMQKVKSGRGRKPLPRDENGNIIRESAPMGTTNGNNNFAPQAQASQIDHSTLLVEPIKIISMVPARKHDIPDLAFDDQEAQALAQSIDKVFNAYFPDIEKMSPKAAAWISFGMVTVSLTVSKVSIYQAVMMERKKNQKRDAPRPVSRDIEGELEGEPGSTSPSAARNPFAKRDPFARA